MKVSLLLLLSIATVVLLGAMSSEAHDHDDKNERWLVWGRDRFQSRNNDEQKEISRKNVHRLQLKWVFNASSDVSATPSVLDGVVYFPDFGGFLWALNAKTSAVIWSRRVSDITGIPDDYSRGAPILIEGRDVAIFTSAALTSCFVYAVRRSDGAFLWKTKIEDHPAAWITATAGYYKPRDLVVVGTSSNEGAFALDPNYPCCSFRGSYVAVCARTGTLQWKTYMIPPGYAGAPAWGAGIAYDKEGRIFVATGQGYKAPDAVNQCLYAQVNDTSLKCIGDDVHINSIVALKAKNGEIDWGYRSAAPDFFNLACILAGQVPNCNNPPGQDMDFSMNPMLIPVDDKRRDADDERQDSEDVYGMGPAGGDDKELVVAATKAGVVFAVNSRSGKLEWGTVIGPGNNAGPTYGGAFDDDGIYIVAPNTRKAPWILQRCDDPSGDLTVFSLITRLDRKGRIVWQVPDPYPNLFAGNTLAVPLPDGQFGQVVDITNGKTMSPFTVSNGVLFTCTMSQGGTMYARSTKDGEILWQHPGNVGSCNSGPSLVDGRLYWGSGFGRLSLGLPDNKVYSFGL